MGIEPTARGFQADALSTIPRRGLVRLAAWACTNIALPVVGTWHTQGRRAHSHSAQLHRCNHRDTWRHSLVIGREDERIMMFNYNTVIGARARHKIFLKVNIQCMVYNLSTACIIKKLILAQACTVAVHCVSRNSNTTGPKEPFLFKKLILAQAW